MKVGSIKMKDERRDKHSQQTDGEPRTNCPGTCEYMRNIDRLKSCVPIGSDLDYEILIYSRKNYK